MSGEFPDDLNFNKPKPQWWQFLKRFQEKLDDIILSVMIGANDMAGLVEQKRLHDNTVIVHLFNKTAGMKKIIDLQTHLESFGAEGLFFDINTNEVENIIVIDIYLDAEHKQPATEEAAALVKGALIKKHKLSAVTKEDFPTNK